MRFIRTLVATSFVLALSASSSPRAHAQGAAPATPPPGPPPAQPPPAQPDASEPPGAHTHDGFHLRLGVGYGYMTTTESPIEAKIKGPGSAWLLTIGGTPVPGLVIGGTLYTHIQPKPTYEFGGQSGESSKAVFLLGIGPMVDFYPDPKGGLHFGGTLLYSSLNAVNYTSSGYGAGLFGGYDFFFSNQWSVGPLLQAVYSKTSKDPVTDSTASIALLITVTDH
jgi:hypothetical protein